MTKDAPDPIEERSSIDQGGGDTYVDENNDIRWSEGNSQGKRKGSLAKKPTALIPFDSQTASLASRKRWAGRQRAAETGLIKAAAEYLGVETHELSADEAHGLLVYVQSLKGLEGNTAAAKFAAVATDSLMRSDTQKPEIHAEKITLIQMNFHSLDDLQNYIEQQRTAGRGTNAAFVEVQAKELKEDDPIEVDVLIGGDQ